MNLFVVPATLPTANSFVASLHRHHGVLPGGFAWFCLLAVSTDGGVVCGSAICGRPTNRNNDDGQTVEVIRLATDGTRNAPSLLLGAAARAARAIGAWRIITYTLEYESGASLRGAGWTEEKRNIKSWWTHAGSRTPAVDRDHMSAKKVRWAKHFKESPSPYDLTSLDTVPNPEMSPQQMSLLENK